MSDTETGNPRDVAQWVRRMPLPAPRSLRETLLLLAQYDPRQGLDALLDRVDFSGYGPAEIAQILYDAPLTNRRQAIPPPRFEARAAFKAGLLSEHFRKNVLPSFLTSFPELARDVFVHVPKCAGTDLVMNLGQKQMPLPSVLESPGWLSDEQFLEVIGAHARALPFMKRVFVYGHMEFADYLARCGIRPDDRVFTIIRDPIALMVSQANYAIGRLRQDPDGNDPDTTPTRTHLGISGWPSDITDETLKDLVARALLHPGIAFANQACRHLSSSADLSFEAAIDMIIANNVEITTTERYERWLRERWGIPSSARHNRSDQLLTLHEARRLYASAMFDATGEDQKLFDLVTWALERSETPSITGRQLARLVPARDIVEFTNELTATRQKAREAGSPGLFMVEDPIPVNRYLRIPSVTTPNSPVLEDVQRVGFGVGGNGLDYLRDGWSSPEPNFTWSVGKVSVLELPRCPGAGVFIVQLILRPFVVAQALPTQRVDIAVNGQAIGSRDTRTLSVIEFEVPPAVVTGGQPFTVTLGVPNAAQPRPLNGANDDRMLGICLERLLFRRLRPPAR
jgi:hypothetical protein